MSGWNSYVRNGNNESSYANHGFAMISAVLKDAGHQPFLMDLRSFQSWEHFENILRQQDYEISLISFLTCDYIHALKATEIMKRVAPNKKIIGGGIHLSVTQTKSFPNIDSIVWGEGELHILDIINMFAKGGELKPVYELKPVANLDSLPFVDRQFFNPEMEETSPLLAGLPQPFQTIVAGRGCPHGCRFCAPSRSFISGKKTHIRSPRHFITEVEMLIRTRGVGSLMIHDDLLGTKNWMIEFIEEWDKRINRRIPIWCQLRADSIIRIKEFIPQLSRVGLTYTSVGLESGNQRMLDFLDKGTTVEQNIEACKILHDNDINIFGNFIMGLPTETIEDLDGTERMLSEIRPAFHARSLWTSYPGNHLYDYCKENDLWVHGKKNNFPYHNNNDFDGESFEHYSMHRYPWERKMKGIDYDYIGRRSGEWASKYTGQLKTYKEKPKVSFANLIVPSIPEPKMELPTPFFNTKIPLITEGTIIPLISIIIASYNRPAYFKEALESMFNQTMKEWEVIIIDNSAEELGAVKKICEEAKKDVRVKVVYNERPVDNLSITWNQALDLVRSKYWGTLDNDNKKLPDFCREMTGYLESHPEKDAVVCGMYQFGNCSGIHHPKEGFTLGELKSGNRIDSGEIIWRKEIIDKIGYFDEKMTCLDDWDYIVRAYHYGDSRGFGFLDKILCEYRLHDTNRIKRSGDLGINQKTVLLQQKEPKKKIAVRLEIPPSGMTESQMQVSNSIKDALSKISFVEIDNDKPELLVLSGPLYNYANDRWAKWKLDYPHAKIMALCVEEPQAMPETIKRLDYIDWLATNDMNAYNHYQTILPSHKKEQLLHWNCLGISEQVLKYCQDNNSPKIYDVCFIGYPYPSRIKFIKELMTLLSGLKVVLVGNDWGKQEINDATCFDTIDEIKTAEIGMGSKFVICKHRTAEDLGGFPVVPPASVSRGYIECLYRSLVLIDSDRPYHTFNDGAVLRYDSIQRCAEIIKYKLLDCSRLTENHIRIAYEQAITDFTFKTRLSKILNCYRSPRWNIKIP
ncbi:MAG: glycosyltransferase [Planctomycetota bacterium]|nr:glycosyltransferase [Planctomycetota bacterium]